MNKSLICFFFSLCILYDCLSQFNHNASTVQYGTSTPTRHCSHSSWLYVTRHAVAGVLTAVQRKSDSTEKRIMSLLWPFFSLTIPWGRHRAGRSSLYWQSVCPLFAQKWSIKVTSLTRRHQGGPGTDVAKRQLLGLKVFFSTAKHPIYCKAATQCVSISFCVRSIWLWVTNEKQKTKQMCFMPNTHYILNISKHCLTFRQLTVHCKASLTTAHCCQVIPFTWKHSGQAVMMVDLQLMWTEIWLKNTGCTSGLAASTN